MPPELHTNSKFWVAKRNLKKWEHLPIQAKIWSSTFATGSKAATICLPIKKTLPSSSVLLATLHYSAGMCFCNARPHLGRGTYLCINEPCAWWEVFWGVKRKKFLSRHTTNRSYRRKVRSSKYKKLERKLRVELTLGGKQKAGVQIRNQEQETEAGRDK